LTNRKIWIKVYFCRKKAIKGIIFFIGAKDLQLCKFQDPLFELEIFKIRKEKIDLNKLKKKGQQHVMYARENHLLVFKVRRRSYFDSNKKKEVYFSLNKLKFKQK
jgi:hypothetical protein